MIATIISAHAMPITAYSTALFHAGSVSCFGGNESVKGVKWHGEREGQQTRWLDRVVVGVREALGVVGCTHSKELGKLLCGSVQLARPLALAVLLKEAVLARLEQPVFGMCVCV